jgi:23S rRNA (pseudouridine1915-N3)-methyltransferase
LKRIAPYASIELVAFRDEEALLTFVTRQRARTPAWLVLLDCRGEALSSEELATWLGARRDSGQQTIVFAVGPPSGWSTGALRHAQTILSLGRMTLPHDACGISAAHESKAAQNKRQKSSVAVRMLGGGGMGAAGAHGGRNTCPGLSGRKMRSNRIRQKRV